MYIASNKPGTKYVHKVFVLGVCVKGDFTLLSRKIKLVSNLELRPQAV